ncbi:V-set domain-containing T-cell activation inhibitor 1-like isoform X2 [Embiotoca jacksoni]
MCSFGPESIIDKMFDWKKQENKKKEVFFYQNGTHNNNGTSEFKGRVFHFEDQLVFGNASIVITKTQPGDSGNYTCDFPRDSPSRRAHIELTIQKILKDRTSEKIPGASPEPTVTNLNETKDWALLQCEVRGAFPEPKVQWRNRAGNILHAEEPKVTERGGRFYVTLQTTVNRTDHYQCVATQEEINHQTHREIFVHLNGAASKPSITILGETDDGVLVQCSVRGASPEPKVQLKNRSGNTVPAAEPQVTERGGSYDIILQTTVKKTDYYQCVATQEEINHQISTETYVIVPDQQVGASIGFWFSGVVSLAAVQALCFAAASIRRRIKKRSRRYENKNNEPALSLKQPGTEDRNNIEAGSK